jgi:hypothetical protein
MHSHWKWNDPMIALRIILMCATSFYPTMNDYSECFDWIAIKMNTFQHLMLKLMSFELIYRRSLAYVCDIQYVQASIRHVSSSDEHCTLWKSIKSSTQHESHNRHSIKPTISCVECSNTSHCWFRFSSSQRIPCDNYSTRVSLFNDHGYGLLSS